jgi:ABC-type bacteriocin/lantibiotic exporter with double-glycine peptidase domain
LTQQKILNTLKNNFLDTFAKFLKQLKVPETESSALEYLETHPDEGSILAYADALNHFKIENAAIRIKQEDLITLPTPFNAFSQTHGGTFSVVKNITENTIDWFDTQKGWVNDKLEEFTKTWSGVVFRLIINK